MNAWAQRVLDLRNDGMSLAEIAEAIHLTPSTVSDLSRGRYKQPRADAAVALVELHSTRFKGRRIPKPRAA